MSYLCTIIELIHSLSLEDEEINNLLKEIDEMNRENAKFESQLEEFEREHVRLRIEYHNLETISSLLDVTAIENLTHTSQKMYKDCVELKSLIDKIDFTKILQCYHMEMETKCCKEWQPIEDCFVKTLNWHQKMEQRHIVQKYRQAEILQRETEDANKNQQKSMKESLKQSVELINQTMDKRNNLVLVLIKGHKDLEDSNLKLKKLNQYQVYIENLRQEKFKIQNELQQVNFQAFNPMLNSNSNSALAIKPNRETNYFLMPKFPSFSDILESFNQAEKLRSITAIENSSSFGVKSILHTSNKLVTTKPTKNVHFKVQLEEYQEEMTETDIETESCKEEPFKTTLELMKSQDNDENLQEMKDLDNFSNIETIDLLTQANNTEEVANKQDSSDLDTNAKQIAQKSMVEIQDCVVFKTPFPVDELKCMKNDEQNKENMSSNVNLNCSKQSTEICTSGSSSHHNITEVLNTTKKSFYEEFLNDSSSPSETSPKKSADNFDTFLSENKHNLFNAIIANDEQNTNVTNNNSTKSNSAETQDFLDFACHKSFTFDSDDNMGNNYNTASMDFM